MIRAAGLLALAVALGGAASLAPHRAEYDLALSASPGGATVSASGHMRFTIHDWCDAWSTEQELTVDSTDREGVRTATRSDYATWETKDGRTLRFAVTERAGSRVTDAVRGVATREGGGVLARFTVPAGLVEHLPGAVLFPTAHTAAVLAAAAAGARDLSPLLFDGTGTAGAEATYARILGWGPATDAPDPALAGMASGRVDISFFALAGRGLTPDYEAGMRYFSNGVSDRLDMDFGAFSLHGQLVRLRLLPRPAHCP